MQKIWKNPIKITNAKIKKNYYFFHGKSRLSILSIFDTNKANFLCNS